MRQNVMIKIVLFAMAVVCYTHTQTWKDDSLVIRGILDTNGLQAVPVDSVAVIKDSGGVTYLRFYNMPNLKILPSSIEKLSKLEDISLNNTGLTMVPPEIGNLKSLWILGISSTPIESLPPEIGNLKSLNSFGVSFDSLFKKIPPEIGKLTSLKSVGFKFCSITKLPDEFCNLDSLEHLDLTNNKLTELPQNIGNLSALHGWVGLQHNNLKSLPQSIMNLNTTPYGVDVCWNDSLVFTPEQCAWYGVKDYKDYFKKYCPNEIEKDGETRTARKAAGFQVEPRTVVLHASHGGHAVCAVYDIKGKRVATLFNGVLQERGHRVAWDRSCYPAGVYYLRLTIGNAAATVSGKVIVTR